MAEAKEATASVLEPFAGASPYDNHGRRVVAVSPTIAGATAEQMRHQDGRDSPRLHLESIKRQLDRDAPEYRQ